MNHDPINTEKDIRRYKEILDSARTCIGPYCKACPVCNGKACGNQVPGPGAKAPGSGFIRNFDAWQKICVNMDTICPNEPVDTAVELFGTMYRYPFFAAPLGAMKLHYGEKYTDREYNSILVNACADSGIAADHLVAHLVYHISLDQWLLVDQILLGLVDLIRVGAV